MAEIKIVVQHDVGLHARPAALFVQLATSFPCEITVRNVSEGSQEADAKSILGVLTLGVMQGDTIAVEATGERAEEALAALQQMVANNFEE